MDINILQIGTVLSITVICYLVGYAAKLFPQVKDEAIPAIVGAAGGVLGVIGMFAMPDFPAHDILNAIAVGAVSGLASTGVNQVWKQTNKTEG